MSKEAIFFAIDAGNSMDQPYSEDASRLKVALQCFKLTLQQKLVNNMNHEIGFCIFGDNESDDGENLNLQAIQKPTMDLVRKITQMSQARLQNTKKGGDIFCVIEHLIGVIAKHCGKKVYNKRAFVFTNGMGQTKFLEADLPFLIGELQKNSIKLNIIPIDFMENYDMEENLIYGEPFMSKMQEKNAFLLMKLRKLQFSNVQIFPASLAIELYKKFRKRDVNPVAVFKGALQLAPDLLINVTTFKAIRRERLKSLAKYDTKVPFDPEIHKQKEILTQITYIIEKDETGALIDKDNRTNAYYYGPHLVPISQILQKATKVYEQKNFRLLGFVDKNKIPRECLMSEVEIVVPFKGNKDEDLISQKLFTAFIYSMISLSKYGVARYVPRNCQNGVNPRMVVLIPYRSLHRQMFYLIQIPTIEDIRDYPFNSLKKSTESQRELIQNMINKMSLYNKIQDEQNQQIKIENTFNPMRQYFFQSIFYRALDKNNQIPDLDPIIKKYLCPEEKKFEKTQYLMQDIKKQFKLEKKQLAKQKIKQKGKIIWKDLLDQTKVKSEVESQVTGQDTVVVNKKFTFEDDQGDHIDPNKPVISFRKMLNNNKKDLVCLALQEMIQYIQGKLQLTITPEQIKHIVQCCAQLRRGCLTQKEEEFWDSWLNNCRSRFGNEIFNSLKSQGLGFILTKNNEIYRIPEKLKTVDIECQDLD